MRFVVGVACCLSYVVLLLSLLLSVVGVVVCCIVVCRCRVASLSLFVVCCLRVLVDDRWC